VRLRFFSADCSACQRNLFCPDLPTSRAALKKLLILGAVFLFLGLSITAQGQVANPCPNAKSVPPQLRIPAKLPPGEPVEFEKQVLQYLSTLEYRKLGWCEDKWVRDTGPFMKGSEAIVHPPVRIFYSPEVSQWLVDGRNGDIPDGAVIIKEQFAPAPAARYSQIPADKLGCSNDWTFMIKNSAASRDGWFWGEVWNSETYPMSFTDGFQYPNAGYGLYCLRCHSSAEKEHTFATLNNIKGAPGWPLQFRVDDSWITIPAKAPGGCGHGLSAADPVLGAAFPMHAQNATLEAEPVRHHALLQAIPPGVQTMPPEPLDDVLAPPAKAGATPSNSPQFVTSAQCLGCHSGLSNSGLGPSMVVLSDINVSPYGEWRWSPMGLAGRDPVFYSQLDSEIAYLKNQPSERQKVVDICASCHGIMGKRTFAAEHPKEDFKIDFVYATNPPEGKYGGLARDGISCMVCHQMAAPVDSSLAYFLKNKINGNFDLTPHDQLNGPFQDNVITTYPMDMALGIKPKYNAYIQSPQMCGSCHTIVLPVLDSPHPGETSVEQATYPEWLNSQYRNEYGSAGMTPRSCQDCHMPTGYINHMDNASLLQIQTRMAIVQDLTLPATEHLATPEQLNVRYRTEGYRRHELLGINGFLLEMFLQPVNKDGNNDVLGVRMKDYMSGFTTDLENAVDNVVEQAQRRTATLEIPGFEVQGDKLIVDVAVTNLAGHRFPSGVGFRRAFLEFQVAINGKTFWTSGTTNDKGEITDMQGRVLPSESFLNGQYQPHYSQQNPIKSGNEVQIYEELVADANGKFTTSFTRRDHEVKDNRLLPAGWSLGGPSDLKIPEQFLEATWPKGEAREDPVYLAGKGQSIVRYEIPLPSGANASNLSASAALYLQTMPPYFLADRYQTATTATSRLKYLATSLGTLADTDFANWKLLVASANRKPTAAH
jgi:mono/diheme cytochrome c family protein